MCHGSTCVNIGIEGTCVVQTNQFQADRNTILTVGMLKMSD